MRRPAVTVRRRATVLRGMARPRIRRRPAIQSAARRGQEPSRRSAGANLPGPPNRHDGSAVRSDDRLNRARPRVREGKEADMTDVETNGPDTHEAATHEDLEEAVNGSAPADGDGEGDTEERLG